MSQDGTIRPAGAPPPPAAGVGQEEQQEGEVGRDSTRRGARPTWPRGLLPPLQGELELEAMRAAALTLFVLLLMHAGVGQTQHRRVTLLVRPNELVPTATRVSVSDCDSLACVARQVKQQLGLDGPAHGLGRRIVLTPALVDGRDAVPVPFESLDEIDDVAKVQLWWVARPEPECEQLLAAERDAALREQRAAVLEAQAVAANSGKDAGAAHELAAALRAELAESNALAQQHAAQLVAARAQVNSTEVRATGAEKTSRELREQLERAIADLAHSQTQLGLSVDRIATLEAELNLSRAHTQRAIEDCEAGAADSVASACTEEQHVISSLKLQQAQQQAAAEECSAALLAKSEEAAAAETARQEQEGQCAAKLLAAESSRSETAAAADQLRRESLAAARAACADTTKALVDEAKQARTELHEAEQRCARQLEDPGAQASASADDECICVQDECKECPVCAACPKPLSMPVECPECPVCQTCHPCDCPQCEACPQCPDATEDKTCPACPKQNVCEQCNPCPEPKECQPCEVNAYPVGDFQDGTAVARGMLSKVADQAQATYLKAPKLSDVVDTVTDSVADVARAMPHPHIHLPTVQLPTIDAAVVLRKTMNVAICVALIIACAGARKLFARVLVRASNQTQTQPDEGEPPEKAYSAPTSATIESLRRLNPSELVMRAEISGAKAVDIQKAENAKDRKLALIRLIINQDPMSGIPEIVEAIPPATTPRHAPEPQPEPAPAPQPMDSHGLPRLEPEPGQEIDVTTAELTANLQRASRTELQALATVKGISKRLIDQACDADNREAELIRLILASRRDGTSTDAAGVQTMDELARDAWVPLVAAVILILAFDASLLETIVLLSFALGVVTVSRKALHSAHQKRAQAIVLLEETLRSRNLSVSELKAQAQENNLDIALISRAYDDPDPSNKLIELIASARLRELIASTETREHAIDVRGASFHQMEKQLETLSDEIASLDTSARSKKQKQKALSLVKEIQVGLRSPELSPRSPLSLTADPVTTSEFADVTFTMSDPGKSTDTTADVILHLMPSHLGWTRVGTRVGTDGTSRFPLCDFLQPQGGGGTGGLFHSEDAWISAQLLFNVSTSPREIKLTFRRRGGSGRYRVEERDIVLRELTRNQRAETAEVLSPLLPERSRSPDTARDGASPLKLALWPNRGACSFTRVSDERAMSVLPEPPICIANRDGKITALCDHTGRGVMQQGSGLHYLEFRLAQVHSAGVELGICKESLANTPKLPGSLTDKAGAYAYCTSTGLLRVGGQMRSAPNSQMVAAAQDDVIGLLLDLRGQKSSLSIYKQDRTSLDAAKNRTDPRVQLLGTVKCLSGPVCWFVTTNTEMDMVQIGSRRSDPPIAEDI